MRILELQELVSVAALMTCTVHFLSALLSLTHAGEQDVLVPIQTRKGLVRIGRRGIWLKTYRI